MDLDNSEYKKHIRQLEFDLEDSKQKNEKRDLQLCQLECENRVFKRMMRKYDDLVDGLRQTVIFKFCGFFCFKKILLRNPLENF